MNGEPHSLDRPYAERPTTQQGSLAEHGGHRAYGDAGVGRIRAGDRFDRYRIEQRIGMGGGGVVYAAHDDLLDRAVALKLLWVGSHNPEALVREAQALAQLSHPNILPIYDVGTDRGRPFIVMELVDGGSMERWLHSAERSPAEIIAAIVQAARGLAQAHRQGIVHRDFKLDNVLVCQPSGGPPRVLITDFGLATRADTLQTQRMGTPPYMAPEQHRCEPCDAATDQFAVCVALFRALYGKYPFEGDGHEQLLAAKQAGRVRSVPHGNVPRRVHRAIARGLSARPADRFASIDALIDALAVPRRLRWLPVGLAVVALGSAAAVIAMPPPTTELCLEPAATLWSIEEATQLQLALDDNHTAFAHTTATQVDTMLARYADEWTHARTVVCDGLRDPRPIRRSAIATADECLHRARLRFRALSTVLAQREPSVAEHAVRAAETLPSPSACIRQPGPLVGDLGPMGALVEARLAKIEALRFAGQFESAIELSNRTSSAAKSLGSGRLVALSYLERGRSQIELARHDEGLASLKSAYYSAVEANDDNTAREAAVELLKVTARGQPDPQAALFWDRTAQSLLSRGTPTPEAIARLLSARAEHALTRNEIEQWLELHRQALAIHREIGRPSLALAAALEGFGRAKLHTDEREEALALFAEALKIRQARLGNKHPWLAVAHNNYGVALAVSDKQEEALVQLRAGLAILQASLPSDHPRLARTRANLGRFLVHRGDSAAALEFLRPAVASLEKANGREHRETLAARSTLVGALGAQKQHAAALEHARRLVTDARAAGQPPNALAKHHGSLASALAALGDDQAALEAYRDALQLAEEDPADAGFIKLGLARLLKKLDRDDEAMALAREMMESFETLQPVEPNNLRSHLAVLLAQLHLRRGERDTALAYARTARETLPAYGEADTQRVGRIDALIAELR